MSETSTIAARLAWLLQHLVLSLGSHAQHLNMPPAFSNLIAARLMRLGQRLSHLLARGPVAARLRRPPQNPANPSANPPCAAGYALPTGFAWLRLVFPGTEVALACSQLAAVLDDPETQSLIANHRLLARSLRPLCHMLGLKTPLCLTLPRRRRTKPAAAQPPTQPQAKPPTPRKPRTLRIFWRPAPPPPPMTPAEARYAAQRFLNPRDFFPN